MPLISRDDIAGHLNITPQEVSNLAKKPGCPKKLSGGRVMYQWPEFNVWYWTVVKAPPTREDARARREAALAEQEELKLEEMRGRLGLREDYERRLREILSRTDAKFRAVPNRLAPAVVGVTTTAEALEHITPLVDEVRAELRTGGHLRLVTDGDSDSAD